MGQKKPTDKYAASNPEPSAKKKRHKEAHVIYSHQIQGYQPQTDKPPDQVRIKNTKANNSPKSHKRALYILIITILSAVFVFASIQLVLYLVHSRQAKQEEQMIQTLITQGEADDAQAATAEPVSTPELAAVPAIAATPTAEPHISRQNAEKPDVLIQFTKALSLNSDTVGQLEMGESISTYVVQRDNSYYLRHSFLDEYSISGAIFLDVSCSIYPQSRNLIIHGHNMQDGTAFGKLSRFENIDYLNQYPFIEFSTLYESARYRPFAVVYYSIDPDSDRYVDIYSVNSMNGQQFCAFITKVQLMSVYHLPINVAATDKILTVTTCTSANDDMRFAVFAVKYNAL